MDEAELKPAPSARVRIRPSAILWLLTAVLLGGLVLVLVSSHSTTVPTHAGRSADAWLLNYANSKFDNSTNAATTQQASVEAFRQMGTNGISFLIECLGRKDTPWARMALRFYPVLPTVVRQRISQPVAAESMSGTAFIALLHVSEEQPDEALPQVLSHLNSSNSRIRLSTWRLFPHLASFHPSVDFEPYEVQLQEALNDTSYWIRLYAVDTMLYLGKADSEMISALSPALRSGDVAISNSVQALIRRLEKLPPTEP